MTYPCRFFKNYKIAFDYFNKCMPHLRRVLCLDQIVCLGLGAERIGNAVLKSRILELLIRTKIVYL